MKELIGKTVVAMHVNQHEDVMRFTLENGEMMYYEAEAGCCSETWFADIIFTNTRWKQSPFPMTIKEVEEIEVPDWVEVMFNKDGRGRQEHDQVYGYNILSSGANINIVYRNSSNGCYGGWCSLLDPEGRWGKQKLDDCEWIEITDDWRA